MKDDVDKMKHKIKLFLIPFMLLATLFFVTACSEDPTAYDNNDAKGHTVSVKYDANGGVFTGTSSIMVDSFNIADMKKDSNGMVNLKLLDPTDEKRGKWDAANGSMVLAGWYRERTESSTDSEGKKVYSYSGKFNFDTDVVTVDPSKTYTSAEPVLTLYALWIPKFEVRFLSLDNQEVLGTYEFSPMNPDVEIKVPEWSTETGRMEMYNFPSILNQTFEAVYSDAAGTTPIEGTITHPGEIDWETGEVQNSVMDVYVKYKEGNWYNIYNAKQLYDIADYTGHYVIHADLDFTDVEWPAAFARRFSGEIIGNNHTIKNVKLTQNNISRTEFGLFGAMMDGAKISNVTFENITVAIEAGTRTPGSSFGLLAASIGAGVKLENIKILNSKLQISGDCFWGTSDYSIGLLCGMGSFTADNGLADIDFSGITCEATGEKPITITVDGNTVTIAAG